MECVRVFYSLFINSFNNLVCVLFCSLANFLNLFTVSNSKEIEEKEDGLFIFNHPFSRFVIFLQCDPIELIAGLTDFK